MNKRIFWLISLITLSIVKLFYFCLFTAPVCLYWFFFLITNEIVHLKMFIDHLYFLFIKVIVQIFCLIFYWVSYLILLGFFFFRCLYIFWDKPFARNMCCNIIFFFDFRCQSLIIRLIYSLLLKQFFLNIR